MTDYAEILIRIREETRKAQFGFMNDRLGAAESASIELLRLSANLMDCAEDAIERRKRA